MFTYDPGVRLNEFRANGYALLENILDAEFRDFLAEFYQRSIHDLANEISAWNIRGKKRQYLFDFPTQQDADEFRNGMARLTGIDPERLTISERHLKVYLEDAPLWPAPHKDRAASEVSIGLPIHIPAGSSACMFPDLNFGPNSEEKAIVLTDSHPIQPEELYRTKEAVTLNEKPGDVIAFLGSSIFHERIRPAGAAILYLKLNGNGRDPLGEDILASEVA